MLLQKSSGYQHSFCYFFATLRNHHDGYSPVLMVAEGGGSPHTSIRRIFPSLYMGKYAGDQVFLVALCRDGAFVVSPCIGVRDFGVNPAARLLD